MPSFKLGQPAHRQGLGELRHASEGEIKGDEWIRQLLVGGSHHVNWGNQLTGNDLAVEV
jgi:hypothetical protein